MKNEVDLNFVVFDFNDISHADITKMIGVSPSKIYVKGEPKNLKVKSLAKYNVWMMGSGKDKYATFDDQMNAILDIFEDKIDVFINLTEKYYCEFSCAIFTYYGNEESTPWIHLNKRYNTITKKLNVEFDIDLYAW